MELSLEPHAHQGVTLVILRSIELLRNPYSETGDPISLATLNEEHDHKWRRLRNIPDDCRVTNEFGFDLLIFENEAAIAIDSPQFTKEMSVNFTFAAQPANGKVAFGLFAKPLDNGPTDERIFGSKAKKYILKPEHIPLYNGENRGIKVEYSPR